MKKVRPHNHESGPNIFADLALPDANVHFLKAQIVAELYRHPAVAAAAVVAKPDDRWGETPCAFVELKPGQQATTDELVAWCRQHLASYKCPRYVVFTELPKTSTGKIQKFKLRSIAREM